MTDNSISPLPPARWDPSLSQIIEDMNGRPLNVHCLMANQPTLLKAWWNYRLYSVVGGDLEQRHCELVILRVAVHMRTWYEWGSHVVRAQASGLTLEEIERVKEGPDSSAWSPAESLLLRAVDELLANHAISAVTRDSLKSHFTELQMLDVISLHSVYIMIGCMINTWELQLDEHVAAELPDSINQSQFESEFPRS